MELKEYTSRHLGVPYVYLKDEKKYLCENGVVFTKEEYLKGIDLNAEYKKRSKNGGLYDYEFARKNGKLRLLEKEEIPAKEEPLLKKKPRPEGKEPLLKKKPRPEEKEAKSVIIMSLALMLTSFGSMYISTVHTATYLFDYTDKISSWLMSFVITVYCATAFEVVLLFFDRKRYVLSSVFAVLWLAVVTFSMATTISVFYDRYNFNMVEAQSENKETDSARLTLEVLREQEKVLRESIEFKRKDIEYRQEREYATTAVRVELEGLQNKLQANLDKQMSVLSETPEAVKAEGEVRKKESLFAFLGRQMKLDGGILEFIMSTLSAVFINLISPLSVSVVVSFLGGMSKNERIQTRS